MTDERAAKVLAGLPRYRPHGDGPRAMVTDANGRWLHVDDVLAAIEAEGRRIRDANAKLAEKDGLVVTLWQPIETAPRGGEWFMARTAHGTTRAVHFADEYDRFPISHDGVVWSTAPVEWMPLNVFPDLLARIAALTAQNQTWQRNSRETFDAMVAMRNSINEHLPMPSLESDLLQGPENSVFCAAVAEAVVSEVHRLRAKVARLERALIWCSGSADFHEGGFAREGWLKLCAPLIIGAADE